MKEKPPIKYDYEFKDEGWNWRDILALGLAIMFVCLGMGGCSLLFDVGTRIRESKTPLLELPK